MQCYLQVFEVYNKQTKTNCIAKISDSHEAFVRERLCLQTVGKAYNGTRTIFSINISGIRDIIGLNTIVLLLTWFY